MEPNESKAILIEVQQKLLDVMDSIKDLPKGYQYKVREMLSCAETIVSMYNDIQHGVIPEILTDNVNIEDSTEELPKAQHEPQFVREEPKKKAVLDVSNIEINI